MGDELQSGVKILFSGCSVALWLSLRPDLFDVQHYPPLIRRTYVSKTLCCDSTCRPIYKMGFTTDSQRTHNGLEANLKRR